MERGGSVGRGGGGDRVGLGVLGYLRHDIIVEGLLPVSYARRSCDGDESRLLDGPDAKDAVVPPHVDAARRQDGELHLVFKSSQKKRVRYIYWHNGKWDLRRQVWGGREKTYLVHLGLLELVEVWALRYGGYVLKLEDPTVPVPAVLADLLP